MHRKGTSKSKSKKTREGGRKGGLKIKNEMRMPAKHTKRLYSVPNGKVTTEVIFSV